MQLSGSSNGSTPGEFAGADNHYEAPPDPCSGSGFPLDGKTVFVLSRLQFQNDLLNMYLEGQAVKKIDELAERRGVDRSAILRSFLLASLKEESIRALLDDVQAGT